MNGKTEKPAQPASQEPAQNTGSKTLVLYFPRIGEQYTVGVIEKGNTAIVAGMIAEKTGADSFEILPADDHYPMTYSELTDIARREQQRFRLAERPWLLMNAYGR